jgi:penicillin-binding protein 1A
MTNGPPRRRRRSRIVLVVVLLVLALGPGAFAGLWLVTPATGDAARRVADRLSSEGAEAMPTLPVPDRVGTAVVATEDRRFFTHSGVDPIALVRVVGARLLDRGDQGGATLDQQLTKLLYTGDSSGAWTELEQAMLAVKLDQSYSKAGILRMYLDAAYFGHGYYGLTDAAVGYFGATPAQLTWGQASLLAGLLQAPGAYDPYVHPDLARSREQHVLDRLVAVGDLSRRDADAAYAAPLGLVAASPETARPETASPETASR